jgi:hypothetical protein
MVIAQRAVELPALRAVAAAATVTGRRTRPTLRPIPRRVAAAGAGAPVADPVAAQGRAGRAPVRP